MATARDEAWKRVPQLVPFVGFMLTEQTQTNLAAGWFSKAVSLSIMYPILQTRHHWCACEAAPNALGHDIPDRVRSPNWVDSTAGAMDHEGPTSLWSGSLAASLTFWPTSVCNLMLLDALKVLLPEGQGGACKQAWDETLRNFGPEVLSYPLHVLEIQTALSTERSDWLVSFLIAPMSLCERAWSLVARPRPWGVFAGLGSKAAAGLVERLVLRLVAGPLSGILSPQHVAPAAKAIAVFTAHPLMLLNVNVIADVEGGANEVDVAKKIIGRDGVIGLWRGVLWSIGPELLLSLMLSNPTFRDTFTAGVNRWVHMCSKNVLPLVMGAISVPHSIIRAFRGPSN